MTQILTICRIGSEWGFKDVTGAEYGHSANINLVFETAQGVAQRVGAQIVFSPEADQHFRDQTSASQPVDTQSSAEAYSPGRFRSLLARLALWRRVK